MTGGGTHLMKMEKFVPVEERIRSSGTVFCFQWNAFPQQQMLKNSQEIAIIASPALPLEAFPPSSGSENGCHFIEMPPPRFLPSPPPFSKGTRYVPVVVLGRALCTSNSCSRDGRDIEY